ncbi:MAG: asparagine synthetase B, partial [Armatimonadetes bacterium]|nr:asparagine synthetase B [Armatimonadota bacterium]NIT30789.1 asparagine synthetase B [Armatimonadota bacterium]
KAFEDLLPAEIIWRDKEQFDEGSGSVDLLSEAIKSAISEKEAALYRSKWHDAGLRSPEEYHYHRLFMDAFENPEPILKNVAHWADRPPEISCPA